MHFNFKSMTKFLLIFLIVIIGACNENSDQNTVKEEASGITESEADTAISNCVIVALKETHAINKSNFIRKGDSVIQLASSRVRLSIKNFTSTSHPHLRASADSAMYIASVLLNSKEFQDSVNRYTFTCRNYWRGCKPSCTSCADRFSGRVVLDSAYRHASPSIDLILDNRNVGALGSAAMNVLRITSHYPPIRRDAPSLPFSYSYAYHIAHEYMHIVGFSHTDHVDDVAEKVGWIGYFILKRWHKEGINPMAVVL